MPLAGGTPAGHRGWGGYGYHPMFTGTTEDQRDHSTEDRYHPQERPQERLQTTGEISDHEKDLRSPRKDLRSRDRPQTTGETRGDHSPQDSPYTTVAYTLKAPHTPYPCTHTIHSHIYTHAHTVGFPHAPQCTLSTPPACTLTLAHTAAHLHRTTHTAFGAGR